jgi:hypothetical protein
MTYNIFSATNEICKFYIYFLTWVKSAEKALSNNIHLAESKYTSKASFRRSDGSTKAPTSRL